MTSWRADKETGDIPKAMQYFEQFKDLYEELYRDYPKDVKYKRGVASSYKRLGNMFKNSNVLAAKIFFEKAKILYEELVKQVPEDKLYQEINYNLDQDL